MPVDEQKPYSYVTLGEEKLDDLESDYRIFWGLRG